MKLLKETLKSRGLHPSFQRVKILEYLEKHMNHPTVEMIYNSLSRDIPTISKTTIYNTLTAFLDKGLISELTISGSEVRYEHKTNPHSHFFCKKCARIVDLDDVESAAGPREVRGNLVQDIHIYFKGLCQGCAGKKKGGK